MVEIRSPLLDYAGTLLQRTVALMGLEQFSQESAEEFRKELKRLSDAHEVSKEDLKSTVDGLRDENKALKSELAILGNKVNGLPMQLEAFAKQFEGIEEKFKQSAEMWSGDRSSDVAKEIKQGFIDLIQYKKNFEAKMDARMGRKETTRPPASVPASTPATGEPMAVDIDIGGIDWMQKNMEKVGLDASWAWAFAYTQEGDVKPETKQLVDAIRQYGNVTVGRHVIGLSGRDGNLLQRKIPKQK